MARNRFQAQVIQLPVAPDGPHKEYLDDLRRALELFITAYNTPSIFRCHEVDFINPQRHGWDVPVNGTYIDENGFVRVVQANDFWLKPVQGTGQILGATLS